MVCGEVNGSEVTVNPRDRRVSIREAIGRAILRMVALKG